MKYNPLPQLAPCMVATLIALTAASTPGQDPVHIDPVPDPVHNDFDNLDPPPIEPVPVETNHSVHTDHATTDSSSGSYVGDISSASAGILGGTLNGRCYNQPDLFYNYYSEGFANRANAQMYLSPLPIPPNVGHTFFTYQPFYPHHMLYKHTDKYHSCYDKGRGMNRTRAKYWYPPIHQAASNLYWNYLRLPR